VSNFNQILDNHDWDAVKESIYTKTGADVLRALHSSTPDINDFAALISPAASGFLEEMAQIAHTKTIKRFGRTMQMFAPMYLSNECQNICTYCGFSLDNKIARLTLNPKQIKAECETLSAQGFDHILLVTGEANKTVGVAYFKKALKIIRPYFSNISIEVQPLNFEDYKELINEGVSSVLVYQETYNRTAYTEYHPKGKKRNFDYRLETPDRLGQAGIKKIGLGALLGLDDWRTDSFFTALHLDYLEKQYWRSKYSISFPRLRPAEGLIEPKMAMTERDLVQLICAYRIFNEEVELSLSTRESAHFRNHAFKLGITSMSAGSKTNPGGYQVDDKSLEQFETSDERSASQIVELLKTNGYEAVWKDWDAVFDMV